MKKIIVVFIAITTICLCFCGCESLKRGMKTIASDVGGGLERKVTLYSNTGEVIKEWSGKFDMTESENEIWFDLDGKRVIIHGGIVISEEE